MLRFAVVGNPVSHSKSPLIHSLFAKQIGLSVDYSRVKVEHGEFENFVTNFFAGGGNGLNITVPFKEMAFHLVENCSSRCQLARAVNTLFLDKQQRLVGDNTDGVGFVTDITVNHSVVLKGRNVLILGAGGAVRGVLSGLAKEPPQRITLLNRTESKARQLQHEFESLLPIEIGSYSELPQRQYDLIINGTSLGLQGKVPPISPSLIGGGCCCYDLMYASRDTDFVTWSKNHGASLALDGLGMLVEQAAESFNIWCHMRPDTAPVIRHLRDAN